MKTLFNSLYTVLLSCSLLALAVSCTDVTSQDAPQGSSQLQLMDGTSLTFGPVLLRNIKEMTGSIKNTGNLDVELTKIEASHPFSVKFTGCAKTLRPEESCEFTCKIQPIVLGETKGIIELFYEAESEEKSVALPVSVVGSAPGELTFLDPELNIPTSILEFGQVFKTSSKTLPIILFNGGSADAKILSAKTVLPSSPFSLVEAVSNIGAGIPDCASLPNQVLTPGAKCGYQVKVAPLLAGQHTGQWQIVYTNPTEERTVTLALRAMSKEPGNLVANSEINIGYVTPNTTLSDVIGIMNTGGADAEINIAGITGLTAPFSFKGGAFLASGTCGNLIKATSEPAACTVGINFTPMEIGKFEVQLQIPYSNGIQGVVSVLKVMIKGEAVSSAVTFAPTPALQFADTFLNLVSAPRLITVTNRDSVPVQFVRQESSLPALPFRFAGGPFPGTGGNCSFNEPLAAGASCKLMAEFRPTENGEKTTSLVLHYQSIVGTQMRKGNAGVLLKGTGVSPANLVVYEGSPMVDFGEVLVGRGKTKVLVIKNIGGLNATNFNLESGLGNSPFRFTSGSYPGLGDGCGRVITKNGGTCRISLSYLPNEAVGIDRLALNFSYQNGRNEQPIAFPLRLSGNGARKSILAFEDVVLDAQGYFDFGAVTPSTSKRMSLRVRNIGNAEASGMRSRSENGILRSVGGYPGEGGSCEGTLRPQQYCMLSVMLRIEREGRIFGTYIVDYNNGSLELNGKGFGNPPNSPYLLRGPSFDLGQRIINKVHLETLAIYNPGPAAATVSSISALQTPFQHVSTTCSGSVPARSTCLIVIGFTPTSPAVVQQNLSIGFNRFPSISATLKGSGQNCEDSRFGVDGIASISSEGRLSNILNYGSSFVLVGENDRTDGDYVQVTRRLCDGTPDSSFNSGRILARQLVRRPTDDKPKTRVLAATVNSRGETYLGGAYTVSSLEDLDGPCRAESASCKSVYSRGFVAKLSATGQFEWVRYFGLPTWPRRAAAGNADEWADSVVQSMKLAGDDVIVKLQFDEGGGVFYRYFNFEGDGDISRRGESEIAFNWGSSAVQADGRRITFDLASYPAFVVKREKPGAKEGIWVLDR